MRYNEDEKAMWLEDWRQSGKTAWAYAKGNGLNLQTFSKWVKAEGRSSAERAIASEGSPAEAGPCFVEVPALVTPPFERPLEILIEKGDVKIHIPLSLGRGELRAIMEGLGAAL